MRRNRYLYQLIWSSCILIIVPTILFFVIFYGKSYNEIKRNNTEYYTNITQLFCGTVVNEISQLKDHAVTFSVDSKKSINNSGIFFEGTSKMKQNAYYYWEACRVLSEFNAQVGYDTFSVYYYDADVVLYGDSKYTADEFINSNLLPCSEKNKRIEGLFDVENYESSKIIFAPIYNEAGGYKALLVGFCTVLGKHNEKALCFYQMQTKDMEFFYQSVQGRFWEKYYVLDSITGDFLFGFGELDDTKVKNGFETELLYQYYIGEEDVKGHPQDTFVLDSKQYNLIFVIDVSENAEQNIVHRFYHDVKRFIIYILLSMGTICCFAVYYNYRPIQQLMKKMKGDGENEFDIIYNTWNEQQILIMDLLMNHLIYGLPISEEHVRKLGVSDDIKIYIVFYIEGYVLDSREITIVKDEVEREFRTELFITDLQGEKSTVLIAFLEKDNVRQIEDKLIKWCLNYVKHSYSFYTGCVVNEINDISKSLNSCKEQSFNNKAGTLKLNQEKIKENTQNRIEKYNQLVENILDYLDKNYQDKDLNQTMVADYFHVSVYSVSRMCKKQFGMSFTEYVNGKRLEKAKELLLKTNLSVKNITIEVGFSDANYFAKVFKENYGISPMQFRNLEK